MTTSAAENLAGHPAIEKKEEKVEKRRALGRGLESLLPGPRVVKSAEYPVPGAGTAGVRDGADETKVPRFARDDKDSGRPLATVNHLLPVVALSQARDVRDVMASMPGVEREVLFQAHQTELGMAKRALPIFRLK